MKKFIASLHKWPVSWAIALGAPTWIILTVFVSNSWVINVLGAGTFIAGVFVLSHVLKGNDK